MNFDDISYEEARTLKEHLETLLDSEGWKFVMAFMQERQFMRERELISLCPERIEQMVRFARMKGSLDEIQTFPEIIGQVYSDLTEVVYAIQKEGTDDVG